MFPKLLMNIKIIRMGFTKLLRNIIQIKNEKLVFDDMTADIGNSKNHDKNSN